MQRRERNISLDSHIKVESTCHVISWHTPILTNIDLGSSSHVRAHKSAHTCPSFCQIGSHGSLLLCLPRNSPTSLVYPFSRARPTVLAYFWLSNWPRNKPVWPGLVLVVSTGRVWPAGGFYPARGALPRWNQPWAGGSTVVLKPHVG